MIFETFLQHLKPLRPVDNFNLNTLRVEQGCNRGERGKIRDLTHLATLDTTSGLPQISDEMIKEHVAREQVLTC